MINQKSLKWGFAVLLSLGLSACMDMQRSDNVNPSQHQHMSKQSKQSNQSNQSNANAQQNQKMAHKVKAQKTYASKDPTQKSTPGPTRQAAPQIPVIQ
jgi:hypothetical protein